MPSVDIVVPCYQHGRFLRDCVESVLSQCQPQQHFEIVRVRELRPIVARGFLRRGPYENHPKC